MRARDFIAQLAPVDLDRIGKIFHYLGDHLHEMQTTSGMRLRDETDFRAFCYELAAATQVPRSYAPARANLDFCPDCGHIHCDDDECGFPIGAGRKCLCERRVPA